MGCEAYFMETKDVSVVVLFKECFGHMIKVKINPISGKETICVDDKQVSQQRNWLKLNSFHKFEINSGWALKKGFVQIHTFLLDCVVGIKIVVDSGLSHFLA